MDYFAGSVVKDGKGGFPNSDFDTHFIAPDGSETLTKEDMLWYRTSTTVKEWSLESIIDYVKNQVVANALPDRPDEQLPTAFMSTHAVSPNGLEVITCKDRYWRRENPQTKDWITGRLEEYFQGAVIGGQSVSKSVDQPANNTEAQNDGLKSQIQGN